MSHVVGGGGSGVDGGASSASTVRSYSLNYYDDTSSQFIDINIDSDVDESVTGKTTTTTTTAKKDQRGRFGFRKKSEPMMTTTRKPLSRGQTVGATASARVDICESSFTSTANMSMAMKTDLILSNLSDIGLTDDDDDDDEEEDNEDQEDELNRKTELLDENNNSFVSLLTEDGAVNSTPLHSISLEKLNLIDDTISNSTLSGEQPSKTLSLDESTTMMNRKKNDHHDIMWRSMSLNHHTPTTTTNQQQQRQQRTRLRDYVHLKNMVSSSLVRNDSLVDGLLGDIYDRFNACSSHNTPDSDVFTEMSASSCSRLSGGDSTADHEYETRYYSKNSKLARSHLQQFSLTELKSLIGEMSTKNSQMSAKLIRELKRKDKLASKLNRNCDLLTALLQAKSLKRRVDTQMKFTLNPMPGEAGFVQWKDAMKALARLTGGVPKEFRRSLWLNLAQKYIDDLQIDWPRVKKAAFNDRSNPDDDELGIQIVKDLHRTGCSTFSGHENERDRALLKRVLLAYARYNKSVGYCQGFNIIAALILEIVDKREEDALVCMIYLIDHILPEGYFTNSMHSLAIDMAIFRELLKQKHPKLHGHLNELQFGCSTSSPTNHHSSKKQLTQQPSQMMNTYEPPLTNVFTMQWFLTLFATCLPKNVLLRVWDSIFLDGAEILFRTAIAIWDKLSISIMKAHSADSFYSMMSVLSLRLLDQNAIDENDLINKIYSYGPFPLPGLKELKEKFTFNIKPFISQDPSSEGGAAANKSKNSTTTIKLIDGEFDPSNVDSQDQQSDSLRLRKTLNDEVDESGAATSNNNNNIKSTMRRKVKTRNEEEDEIEDLAQMISCFALLMPNRSPTSAITVGGPSSQSSSTTNVNNSQKDIMLAAAAAASTYGLKQSSNNNNNPFSFLDRFVSRKTAGGLEAAAAAVAASGVGVGVNDISSVTPGAFSYVTQAYDPKPLSEKLTTDLSELKKQYEKLKERQRQAYIIMQTASNQQRLNNMTNATTTSKLESNSTTTPSSKSSNSTMEIGFGMLEKMPVVNHLLIKSNDPTRNTVKQTVQLVNNNSGDNSTENNTQMIKEKLKQSNSIISQLLMDKNKKNSKSKEEDQKKRNVYYSDDDDDDDDDDVIDDRDMSDSEDDDDDYRSKGGEDDLKLEDGHNNKSTPPRLSLDTVNRMNLIDLANIDEEPPISTSYLSAQNSSSLTATAVGGGVSSTTSSTTANRTSPSSSSSSSMSSPVLSKAMGVVGVASSHQSSTTPNSKQTTVTRKASNNNNNSNSKKMSTSDVINNLINEEKRQAVPLNPFPTRQINSHVAKNGLRLGLYK